MGAALRIRPIRCEVIGIRVGAGQVLSAGGPMRCGAGVSPPVIAELRLVPGQREIRSGVETHLRGFVEP